MLIKKQQWLIGLLGFLGFLGMREPVYYLFFLFFGGFRYYWWQQIGTATDERLIENKNKAASIAFKMTFLISIVSTLLCNFFINDIHLLYQIELIIIALTFAIGINLWAYFTYQYENGDA